jgi:hypothetical protein
MGYQAKKMFLEIFSLHLLIHIGSHGFKNSLPERIFYAKHLKCPDHIILIIKHMREFLIKWKFLIKQF